MNPADLIASLVNNTVKPVTDYTMNVLGDAERMVVHAVRDHLDELEPAQVDDTVDDDEADDGPPATVLRALLERSMYDTPAQSRDALHMALLCALIPDEARVLAAVSDGTAYPLMHIAEPGVGAVAAVHTNASTVGRAAGVALPHHTPLYVTRLLALGLLTVGPEDATMRDDYEVLLTDSGVHAAITGVSRGSLRPARIIRRTVRISALGQELWEATQC